jgi:predicted lipoprotein with Yx(FWY)xxD motif
MVGLLVAAAAGTATVVEATAGSATPGSVNSAVQQRTATLRLSGTATVQAAKATVTGHTQTILVNAKGLPLYIYQPDTANRSLVTGQLAALWPPLRGEALTASRAAGVTGALTVASTTNGYQVAYNGHFLYTFTEDSPGRVTGQGVHDFFVATPNLATQSPSSAAKSIAPAPAGSLSGY